MRYWICIKSSCNQGIMENMITRTPNNVDISNGLDSYDDSEWREITEDEYVKYQELSE